MDPRALTTPAPAAVVDAEALSRPATPPSLRAGRGRRLVIAAALTLVVLVAGGAIWWRHEVTADPGVQLSGDRNVARDDAGTDRTGIGPRTSKFRSALDDGDEVEVADVRHTPVGDRNNRLNRAAFCLGMLVAGGELDGLLVEDELLAAAVDAGLSEGEARTSIRSGLRAGAKEPRRRPS